MATLNTRLSDEQKDRIQAIADDLTGGNVSALIQAIADGVISLANTNQLWAEVQLLRTSLIANQRQWVECCERMDRQDEEIRKLRQLIAQ